MAPSIMDSLFQRSLDDLIKSLRTPAAPLPTLLSKASDEIRRELKSTDPFVKALALQKLTYLHSLHALDMSFAAFPAVELMSSPIFAYKKIAYLAASLSFHPSTEVLLLLPNQLRKDLSSPASPHDASLALEFLAVASTPDLARELTPQVYTLLSSAKLPLRKKAITLLVRFYDLYPDSVKETFMRLVDNLNEGGSGGASDPGVVSAVVGVFCELTSKDPQSYLPLAVQFYRILTDSRNNWVLIKVVKIFAKLVPLEPRLAKKVVEPLCDIMRKTGAKSLMIECVRAIILSFTGFDSAVRLAAEKIRELLAEEDPNLKYLGLHALTLFKEKQLLWAIAENKEIIVQSLSDGDPNIKLEALHLLMGMCSEVNVEEISKILVRYAMKSDPDFCNETLGSLLEICSRNLYEIVNDFDWYVSLLRDMARVPHCAKGDEIERQMIDIGLRVQDARPELVQVARSLLIDPALLGNPNLYRILAAASWVSGEYVEFSRNTRELMEALLQPRTCLLPPPVRAVYIQSVFKVLVYTTYCYLEYSELAIPKVSLDMESSHLPSSQGGSGTDGVSNEFSYESVSYLFNLTKEALEPLSQTDEVEVHDRACNVLGLIDALGEAGFGTQNSKASEIIKFMRDAFCEELGPVAVNAQERVPAPDGLALKENLADLDSILGEITPSSSSVSFVSKVVKASDDPSSKHTSALSITVASEHRKRHSLFYLSAEKDDTRTSDFPPANNDPIIEATKELVKLTDQTLVTKKTTRVKPRPVVVKLEERDEGTVPELTSSKDLKAGLISGAVQDILLGEERKHSDRSSQGKTQQSSSSKGPALAENQGIVDKSKSVRKSRHHSQSKERQNKSPRNNEDREGKNTRKTSHHHGKHKTRHRADDPATVAPQAPIIQDFLL